MEKKKKKNPVSAPNLHGISSASIESVMALRRALAEKLRTACGSCVQMSRQVGAAGIHTSTGTSAKRFCEGVEASG